MDYETDFSEEDLYSSEEDGDYVEHEAPRRSLFHPSESAWQGDGPDLVSDSTVDSDHEIMPVRVIGEEDGVFIEAKDLLNHLTCEKYEVLIETLPLTLADLHILTCNHHCAGYSIVSDCWRVVAHSMNDPDVMAAIFPQFITVVQQHLASEHRAQRSCAATALLHLPTSSSALGPAFAQAWPSVLEAAMVSVNRYDASFGDEFDVALLRPALCGHDKVSASFAQTLPGLAHQLSTFLYEGPEPVKRFAVSAIEAIARNKQPGIDLAKTSVLPGLVNALIPQLASLSEQTQDIALKALAAVLRSAHVEAHQVLAVAWPDIFPSMPVAMDRIVRGLFPESLLQVLAAALRSPHPAILERVAPEVPAIVDVMVAHIRTDNAHVSYRTDLMVALCECQHPGIAATVDQLLPSLIANILDCINGINPRKADDSLGLLGAIVWSPRASALAQAHAHKMSVCLPILNTLAAALSHERARVYKAACNMLAHLVLMPGDAMAAAMPSIVPELLRNISAGPKAYPPVSDHSPNPADILRAMVSVGGAPLAAAIAAEAPSTLEQLLWPCDART